MTLLHEGWNHKGVKVWSGVKWFRIWSTYRILWTR